jgi:hypothetical protein
VYVSIAEAARSFNTHPKTIWRVIYHNKLYLNRYHIIEQNKSKELGLWSFLLKSSKSIYKYFYYFIKRNKAYIYRILLFIALGVFICTIILFIVVVYKDAHSYYNFALGESKTNYNKCVLEHKLILNHVVNNTNTAFSTHKTNFIYKEWRCEYLFNNKWTSIHNTKLDVYQSIINEINLDFNAKGTATFSGLNSTYSSPIIDRVNINNIFYNAIYSTNMINDTTNSLGIQGINYSNNRNFVIVDNLLINTRVKNTELLNYQSNILYCLINGLSPSTY